MKDAYETLQVSKTATQDEIKKAYRKMAKKFHPDLNPGNKSAEETFKEVNGAYARLETPELRAKYDAGETDEQLQEKQQEYARNRNSYYQTQQNGGRYARSFGGIDIDEDFLSELFGSGRSGGKKGRRQSAQEDLPGEDHMYHMEVDFKDAALGAEREITLPTGKKLLVKIPAGIEANAKLRIKGQGGAGLGKGSQGDAYVQVSIKPLAGFERNGKNIETEVPISFQEGLLGGEIKVPTLDGSVMMKINSGVSTGTRLRIRGKGVGTGENRGDQIVVLKVMLPKKVDPELQDMIRGWAEKFRYDPREEL